MTPDRLLWEIALASLRALGDSEATRQAYLRSAAMAFESALKIYRTEADARGHRWVAIGDEEVDENKRQLN